MAKKQPAALRRYWATHSHKGRKHHKKHRYVTRRAHGHRRHRVRNPFSMGGITNKLMPAFIGAASALASDMLLQKTPIGTYIPASLTTGYLKYIPRAAAVFLTAWVIGKVKPSWRNEALAGGLAVVVYSLLKDLANGAGLSLADYDDVPDYRDLGYMNPASGVQSYLPSGSPQLESYMQNYPGVDASAGMGDFNTAEM